MKRGYILVILAALIFSSMEPVAKFTGVRMDAMSLVFVRFVIGGVFLLPFAWKEIKKRKIAVELKDFLIIGTMGVLFIAVNVLTQKAMVFTKASTVAIVFSVNPVFTTPLAALLLREKWDKRTLVPLVVSLLGVYVFLDPTNIQGGIIGILVSLLAALVFSFYTLLSKKALPKWGGVALTSVCFLMGCLFLGIILAILRVNVIAGLSLEILPHLLYLGIVVAGLGFLVYFLAIKATSAITASTAFFMKIALAPILSFLLLGERMSTHSILGMVLIMLGSAGTLYLRRNENQHSDQQRVRDRTAA